MPTPLQFRALIGPRYDHLSWWTYSYGSTAILDYSSQLLEALPPVSATYPESAQNIFLRNGSAFPAGGGGVWVGGWGGKAYEYIRYLGKSDANTLQALTREPVDLSTHAGNHSASEFCWFWFPLSGTDRLNYARIGDDGSYEFKWSTDANFSYLTWEASLRGVNYEHWALRNNHLVIVQTRANASQPWKIELLGVIDSPTASDDAKREATWTMKVRPLMSIWSKNPSKGLKVGEADIAKGSSATGTTPLVFPFEERQSEDFFASDPDFSASSAIDDDPDTLWLGERFIGTKPNPGHNSNDGRNSDPGLKFYEMYLNPPPGAPAGARWIELVKISGGLGGYSIVAVNPNGGSTQFDLEGDVENGGKVIIAEDRAIFEQMNPLAADALIIEPHKQTPPVNFFDDLGDTAVYGEMRLRLAGLGFWRSWVRWGTGPRELKDAHPDHPEESYGNPTISPGGIISGHTLHYDYSKQGPLQAAAYWDSGYIKNPGYDITTEDEWIAVHLPPLGLFLRDSIQTGTPGQGELLYIVNDAGGPDSAGIYQAGTIQIGDELMTFTANDYVAGALTIENRGVNGTTRIQHIKGDTVRVVEGGVTTKAHMVKSIGWRRYSDALPVGQVNPRNFTVRASNQVEARVPGDGNWQNDYYIVVDVNNYTGGKEWSYTFPNPARVGTLLIQIELMTRDPGRARINEIFAKLDLTSNNSPYPPGLYLPNGTTVFAFITKLLTNAGVPAASIVTAGSNPPMSDVETEDSDNLWTTVTDFADYSGCRIVVGRDSKISLLSDDFWTQATPSAVHTWYKDNTESIEKSITNGQGISQVKLAWRSFDNTQSGEVAYPATPDPVGNPLEISEALFVNGDVALLAARRRYQISRWPTTEIAGGVEGFITMLPRHIHETHWAYNWLVGPATRLHIVTGIDHYIEKGHLFTVAHLQQIEREADW